MLTEILGAVMAVIIAAGLTAVLGLLWRVLLRLPLLMVAIGVGLLALAVILVGEFSVGSMRTEGSPAGTIMFVLYGSVVAGAVAVGTYFATYGLTLLTVDTGLHVALRVIACFAAVSLFTTIAMVQYRKHVTAKSGAVGTADRAAGRAGYEAPASGMTPFEPHPRGPGAARDAAARMRYDECVAFVRVSHRPETLKGCADELVAGWDESHAAKRRFANMPDGAQFAGSIGDMYVAYAEATGDVSGARSGVRGLQQRVLARAPQEAGALERLREAEAKLNAR